MDTMQKGTTSNLLPLGHSETSVTLNAVPMNGTGSGSRSSVENWVLDCEICGRKGVNQVNSELWKLAHFRRERFTGRRCASLVLWRMWEVATYCLP